MPLTSFQFVGFTLVVLALFNAVPMNLRVLLLVGASLVFYANASLIHLGVMCLVIGTTYAAVAVVEGHRSKQVLTLAIGSVLAPLVWFKWGVFLSARSSVESLALQAGTGYATMMPLGISFFTFQAISYIADVHSGRVRPEASISRTALYFSFFPKVLAGPIERVPDFMPQIRQLARSTPANLYVGMKLALWGFFCKLVVADNIGSIVDAVLRDLGGESGATLALVFGLYAFEIYFDFLGYTSIAIGVARCFNLRLSQNFNSPYAATSLRDFWRRWHISLSSWFRDYVYIPLGGNRPQGVSRLAQILVVFGLSGLWHGATLNFLAWGGFHGAAYWMEEQLRRRLMGRARSVRRPVVLLRHGGQLVLTFCVVTTGWVLFRLSDLSAIRLVVERVAFVDRGVPYGYLNDIFARADTRWFLLILLSGIILDSSRSFKAALERVPFSPHQLAGDLAFVNWVGIGLILLGDLGVRDFTYAGF